MNSFFFLLTHGSLCFFSNPTLKVAARITLQTWIWGGEGSWKGCAWCLLGNLHFSSLSRRGSSSRLTWPRALAFLHGFCQTAALVAYIFWCPVFFYNYPSPCRHPGNWENEKHRRRRKKGETELQREWSGQTRVGGLLCREKSLWRKGWASAWGPGWTGCPSLKQAACREERKRTVGDSDSLLDQTLARLL